MKKERCINILNDVCLETIKKYNLDVSCHICSIVDYWLSKEFRDSFKEKKSIKGKLNEASFPLKSAGWFREDKNYIYLLISNNEKKNNISSLIISILHELRHSYQIKFKKDYSEYQSQMFLIEDYLRAFDTAFYFDNHRNFLKEIDADLFAIDYAKEYVGKNKDSVKEKYYNYYKKRVIHHFNLYDDEFLMNRFIYMCEREKLNTRFEEDESKPEIMDILFNEYGFLNSFEDIYRVGKEKLPRSIFDLIISCRSVLDMMNTFDLDDDIREDVIRISNNALNDCLERRKYIVENGLHEIYKKEFSKDIDKSKYYKELLNDLTMSKVNKL